MMPFKYIVAPHYNKRLLQYGVCRLLRHVLYIFEIFVVKILKELAIYSPKCGKMQNVFVYTNLATKLASMFTSQIRNLLQWLFIFSSVNSKVFAKNDAEI